MFSNEDVTIGAWMLAMNVNHEDNRQLCQPECTPSSVAVWDIPKCSGLCCFSSNQIWVLFAVTPHSEIFIIFFLFFGKLTKFVMTLGVSRVGKEVGLMVTPPWFEPWEP